MDESHLGRTPVMKTLFAAVVCAALATNAPARAADLIPVKVGTANSATDVGVFVAQARGFFRDEGLDVSFISFDSAAKMIAPFASGDLDVGGGGTSAGLYNAVARGIEIKIVADKNHAPPGQGIQPLLIRKDLIDSGKFKTLADLKGLKISTAAPGSAASTTLDRALRMGGLKITDVDQVYMGFPQQAVALASKALDAAFTAEPSASQAVASGSAVLFMGDDEIYPNHQLAVVFYSGEFVRKKPDAARRYMRAYLRGVRYYNDAITNGKLTGPRGEEIIDLLAQNIPIKDKAAYRDLMAPACDPDGKMNIDSLAEDLDFYRNAGLIEGAVKLDQTLDTSFADRAVKELGMYARAEGR
jgi:NitT/TauT family transport system substrate-binding protein